MKEASATASSYSEVSTICGGRRRAGVVRDLLALGREDVHGAAPAREAVAVHAREQALREHLEEVVGLEVGLVHGLAQPVHRLGAVAGEDEVVGEHLRAEQVHAAGTMPALRC